MPTHQLNGMAQYPQSGTEGMFSIILAGDTVVNTRATRRWTVVRYLCWRLVTVAAFVMLSLLSLQCSSDRHVCRGPRLYFQQLLLSLTSPYSYSRFLTVFPIPVAPSILPVRFYESLKFLRELDTPDGKKADFVFIIQCWILRSIASVLKHIGRDYWEIALKDFFYRPCLVYFRRHRRIHMFRIGLPPWVV